MAKISRRDFLKYTLLLSSPIALSLDLSKIDWSKISNEQVREIAEIESIKLSDCGPYCLAPRHTWDNKYYDICLRSGDKLWLSDKQIEERYGDILAYFVEPEQLPPDSYPAIWND
jgi:hypothetical protein